jgi:hypothetical protein
VQGQPLPDEGDDHQGGDQRHSEHGVAAQQEREAGLAGRGVGDEQGAGGGRDHRRDDGHEPSAERAALVDAVVPGELQVGDGEGGEQPGGGAGQPQRPVDVHGGPQAEHVVAQQQRAAPTVSIAIGGAP